MHHVPGGRYEIAPVTLDWTYAYWTGYGPPVPIVYPPATFVEYARFRPRSVEMGHDFWLYDMVFYPKVYHVGHLEYERDSYKMPILELPR